MANETFSIVEHPFKYLLTYKYSQDHIELLFSCIRSKGGWNNNPNSLQLKYALRKMVFRNAVKASKHSNCIEFSDYSSSIIPIFHQPKHRSPLIEEKPEVKDGNNFTTSEQMLVEQLEQRGHSKLIDNILFYIGRFIIMKILKSVTCTACRSCLTSSLTIPTLEHDYCGLKSARNYSDPPASAFTQFVNRGGLTNPSKSVFTVLMYAEHVFKAIVSKDGKQINSSENIRSKMIWEVCHHFVADECCRHIVFGDHEPGMNGLQATTE